MLVKLSKGREWHDLCSHLLPLLRLLPPHTPPQAPTVGVLPPVLAQAPPPCSHVPAQAPFSRLALLLLTPFLILHL